MSDLLKPVILSNGIGFRSGQSANGEPLAIVGFGTKFGAGDSVAVDSLAELQNLYVLLGAIIARMRAHQFDQRRSQ